MARKTLGLTRISGVNYDIISGGWKTLLLYGDQGRQGLLALLIKTEVSKALVSMMLCSHTSCFAKGERQYMSIQDTELDYQAGYTRILLYAEQARARGWRLTDRQLVHEILQRERAAQIREKSTLPMLGQGGRSAAWNHGQADALRTLLREQREKLQS